jgi:hypothetical protein
MYFLKIAKLHLAEKSTLAIPPLVQSEFDSERLAKAGYPSKRALRRTE